MTFQEVMDAARKAHAQGNANDAARLVQMGRKILSEAESRRPTPKGYKVVGNDDQGGTVYLKPDGAYAYVSPGASTTLDELPSDLNTIAEGIRARGEQQSAEDVVQQKPIAARAATALAGVPWLGEFTDEAVERVSPQAGQNMRRAQRGMQSRPTQNAALRLGGGIAGVLPAVLAAPASLLTMGAQGLGSRMVGGGIMGALLGGSEGAMSQIGANDPGDRMAGVGQAAASNAILGAGIGAAAEPVTDLAGAAWRAYGPGAARRARTTTKALGLPQQGADIVAEAAARDAPYAAENLANAGRYGVVASTGPNTKSLLDWAVNRPGGGSSAASARINEMAEQAGQQMNRTLDESFGPVQGPNATRRQIMTDSAEERASTYNEAYNTPIDYSAGQDLEALLDRVPAEAIRKAERLMRTEGNRSRQIKFDMDAGEFTELPDVRQIDYITRALRDMGDFGVGEGKEQGRAYMNLARQLRLQLDELVPAYEAARASGKDAIVNREAVDIGRNAFTGKMTREDLSDEVEAMKGAQLGYLRSGVRSYVDDIMARTKAALTDTNQDAREAIRPLKDMLSREGQDKLRIILGDDADGLIRTLKEIYEPLSLRASVAQNSKTQIRANAEEMIGERVTPTFTESMAQGKGLSGAMTERFAPYATRGAPSMYDRKGQVAEGIAGALMQPLRTPGQTQMALRLQRDLQRAAQAQGLVEDFTRRGIWATGLGGMQSRTGQAR